MKKIKSIKIDLNNLIKNNPKINSQEFARVLQMIAELKKQGVNVGPNYNIGSPFSQPEPHNDKPQPIGTVLQPK
jgi:hypothetical protein